MKTILVVLFLVNGSPQWNPNMLPTMMESSTACEQARQEIQGTLEETSPYPFYVACYGELPNGDPV